MSIIQFIMFCSNVTSHIIMFTAFYMILWFICLGLRQGLATSVLEGRCPVEFSSNPNQTHLKKLIDVFKITRKLQAGVFD